MTTITYSTERQALMPMAAPVGAVVGCGLAGGAIALGRNRGLSAAGFGHSSEAPNAVSKPQAWLPTTRFARHLGEVPT
jgi:hypothetical protein